MNRLQTVIIAILLFLLVFRLQQFYQTKSNYIDGQQITFLTTLISEPRIYGNQQRFSVILENGQRISITIPRYPELHYADTVLISGSVKKRVINKKNIVLTIYFPKISYRGRLASLSLTSILRQKITSLFQKTLSQADSSLLLGITFGIKEGMPKDFFEKLQATGVLHVIAASGMNVTMVGGVLGSIFMLFFSRRVALVFSIFGIFFYALLAGFEPSIVRAAIMGGLVFVAQILGRQYLASYGLLLTGVLMLLADPRLLLDIGFQLSFVATMGLIYIKPLISFIPKKFIFGEDIQTTIAAQIATLPILLTNFGTYSIISVLVNGLVLWTVPIVMIIGGVGAVVGLAFESLGSVILYFSLPFLMYFAGVVDFFGKKGPIMDIDSFPWQWVVGYYCAVIAIILYNGQKSRFH